jgi:hypothetical protein
MTPSTIDMLRACLLTALTAATAIEAAALLAIGPFRVSEDVLTWMTFRAATEAAIACVLLVTSFGSVRMPVVLHLRFNRKAFEWARC